MKYRWKKSLGNKTCSCWSLSTRRSSL